jgi:predicted RNA-binding Zn-ribbon protein involved in translation (DUF1610 family)
MDFISLQNFTNYIDAHIVLGKLEGAGIDCWLKDENTVNLMPIWTNAVGGIKLMVAEAQAQQARELSQEIEQERKSHFRCPKCGSNNIELVSTPRKPSNWLTAIISASLGSYAIAPDKVYHCFNCGHEAEEMPTPDSDHL